MMMLELTLTLLASRERKGGVKEQLVRLRVKEQLKVKVARPLRRAWTPIKNITQWENNIRFSNIVDQCIPRERRGERYV